MSGAEKSRLSRAVDGYNFVVVTTQEALNMGLKQYFGSGNLPATLVCFIMGEDGSSIAEAITLDEPMKHSGAVNPFTIPNGTALTDEGIQEDARYLPDVIELGSGAKNIGFRLMCKEIIIIIHTHSRGVGLQDLGTCSVKLTKVDGKDQMWLFETTVNLVAQESGNSLLWQQPRRKGSKIARVGNTVRHSLQPSAAPLNLDSTVAQRVPVIKGMNRTLLTKAFGDLFHELNPEWCCIFYAQRTRPHQPRFSGMLLEPSLPETFSVKPEPAGEDTAYIESQSYTLIISLVSFKEHFVVLEHNIEFNIKAVQGYDTNSDKLNVVETDKYELWEDGTGNVRLERNAGTPEVIHQ
ncbi:hypothetical protein BDV23DRAFT_180268 [Aspergillus alliaceus]|uniref:Uncharacterized protein n=1 Tax=Petromyces alliaceus TaxID=209559 RepID=A0A5N7CIX0_PETAA|nr:hypothetical protein BDV23DRAFT_180268 [Aspergillus alliaceus]